MAPPRSMVTTSSCNLLLIYRPRKDERMTIVLLLCHGTADRQSALQWSEAMMPISWCEMQCPECITVIRAVCVCSGEAMVPISWCKMHCTECITVIRAVCVCSGEAMVPISWCEMQCPVTFTKEYRKVARAQPWHCQQQKQSWYYQHYS